MRSISIFFVILGLLSGAIIACAADAGGQAGKRYYLPSETASKIATVSPKGEPTVEITILTQALAVKEKAPRSTLKAFGEVYAFSPAFIAVRRDEPTMLTFWNLQGDDDHDFALMERDLNVLMDAELKPLRKTSLIFTFHKEGLFYFKCMQHQPAMGGQILVLPPAGSRADPIR